MRLLNHDYDFKIITLDRDFTEKKPYPNIKHDKWIKDNNSIILYLKESLKIFVNIYKIIRYCEYNIIYFNSFLNPRFTIYPLLLIKIFRPSKKILIALRGEFMHGDWQNKKLKKELYLIFYKYIISVYNTFYHVTSKEELKELSKRINPRPESTFIAPNYKYIDFLKHNYFKKLSIKKDILKVIFISRIAPTKNLLYTIKLFREIKFNVIFTIAGPIDDRNYWKECLSAIDTLPKNILVNYMGSLEHEAVLKHLSRNDLFILTTKGENYGHIILESLLMGTPVLISDKTYWKNLIEKNVGWDIPLDKRGQYISTINLIYEMKNDEYMQIRYNAHEYAKNILDDDNTINANKKMLQNIIKY